MLSPRIRIRNTTSLKNYGNVYSKINNQKTQKKPCFVRRAIGGQGFDFEIILPSKYLES
jgi:hypothetical protein